MIKRNITAALIAMGLVGIAGVSQATVLDLGSSGSGSINGAIFQTNNDHPTGTGVYNPFLTVQNSPWEQGYNSSVGNFDTKREPQWNHEIRFSDLQATTINGVQYFGFSVDINEPGGNKSTIPPAPLRVWPPNPVQSTPPTNS